MNGRKERLNRRSFINFLNAEAQKIDSLKHRKLEKGLFFGYIGASDDKEITDLFKEVLKALPNQISPLGAQLRDAKKDLEATKAETAKRKADFAADAKIMKERFYFPIDSDLDNCRNFKSALPQYIKDPKITRESFLIHNTCLRDRYPDDKDYLVFRDELQAKIFEKMETFSNLYLIFTEYFQRNQLISELIQFYPSREEALASVEKKMNSGAAAYLKKGWPVEEIPTKEEWLERNKHVSLIGLNTSKKNA